MKLTKSYLKQLIKEELEMEVSEPPKATGPKSQYFRIGDPRLEKTVFKTILVTVEPGGKAGEVSYTLKSSGQKHVYRFVNDEGRFKFYNKVNRAGIPAIELAEPSEKEELEDFINNF